MTEANDLGPIDSREWPKQLDAHAVTPGSERRMFGYDVEGDLATHYRFSDVVFLALTGELPDAARSRAFDIALCFAMPVSIADAGVHAAVLARLCGARPSGVLSVAALVLGEQASALVGSASDVLIALEKREIERLPDAHCAASDAERASVAALAAKLNGVLDVPVLQADPSRELALLAVFRGCGVTDAFQLASVMAMARIPSALAEASRVKPGGFATYPIDTPHFAYVAPATPAAPAAPERSQP
jgi:hypothetical protein